LHNPRGLERAGSPRSVSVDVKGEQAQPIFSRSDVSGLARLDMPLDMARGVDVLDVVASWLKRSPVRIGQSPFALLVAAEKPPIVLRDEMVWSFVGQPAIEDVDEGLESLERIECQLGNRIFLSFPCRFVGCVTTIY